MKLRSTGLGTTELVGDLVDMEASMSGVIMRVKIKKPVVWRVRVFLQARDLRAIVWRALIPSNIWFVIKTLITVGKPKAVAENSTSTKEGSVKKRA
ncbi:hypothetical protein PITCH_A760026 [uncultured Desulfobacterium sp.]|uniref:Uncharacterized protein n=1 Tax=uncultured Desulfobacterium sp. TaxID=201089 RepID=A0A445N2A2_9BACT|nr:hypothetical protein PITCH_A760026 [uncultured Desulfobacterium sp.]